MAGQSLGGRSFSDMSEADRLIYTSWYAGAMHYFTPLQTGPS